MESPVAAVKSAINPSSVLKYLAVSLLVFAALDFAGVTNWLFYPVTTAKAKFAKKAA